MMSGTKFIAFCLIFLCVFYSVLSMEDFKCVPESDEKADEEFSKLILFTHPDINYPEDESSAKLICAEYTERMRILGNYVKDCKKGLPKQLLSVIVYTIRLQVKNLCKKKSKVRSGLLSAAKCVNAGKAEFLKCNNELIDTLQGIIKAYDKKKVPLTCCAYYKYVDCFEMRGQKIKQCKQDHLETITDFVENIAANALPLICGDYIDGSDKCSKLEAPPKKDRNQKRSKSFFKPLTDVFDSFGEVNG